MFPYLLMLIMSIPLFFALYISVHFKYFSLKASQVPLSIAHCLKTFFLPTFGFGERTEASYLTCSDCGFTQVVKSVVRVFEPLAVY